MFTFNTTHDIIELIMEIVSVFTDGSNDKKTHRSSWAFAVIKDEEVLYQDSGVLTGEITSIWQVGGEIMGVVNAVKYCKENNKKAIIYFDLINLYNWVADIFGGKPWKCKNKWSKAYRKFILENKNHIERFEKVVSHTGVFGNEFVDDAAKRALGLA